jgi:hypothetical protein
MRKNRRAWMAAQQLLQEEGITEAPVDVEAIATKRAHVVQQEMPDEISGMLIPLQSEVGGKRWVIAVNEDHAPVRKRFTIAHELGHLILHGYTTPHADRTYRIRMRDHASSDGSVIEEIEANQFAAELLMPRAYLIRRLDEEEFEYVSSDGEGSRQLSTLARELGVSDQALSIRLSTLLG